MGDKGWLFLEHTRQDFVKLQRDRSVQIMMGVKDWPFPETPSSTIRFPSYKKGDTRRF